MPIKEIIRSFLCCAWLLAAAFAQEPKQLPEATPGDCAACHAGKNPPPKDHVATRSLTMKDCLGCHAKGTAAALTGKLPLSHIHQLSGVTCARCHEDAKNPGPVAKTKCVSCHDPDKLAEATAGMKPVNPHTSPHYGRKSDCNLCHHQHERSENYCSQCHEFIFAVP